MSLSLFLLLHLTCRFETFRVDEWKCIQGGNYPEYQYPRLCSSRNEYIPQVFKIINASIETDDGTREWSLMLEPSRSFKIENDVKRPMYRFVIENFECTSLAKYNASIVVHPVKEETPIDCRNELIVLLFLSFLFLICCVISSHEPNRSDSDFTFGYILGSHNSCKSNSRPHFE